MCHVTPVRRLSIIALTDCTMWSAEERDLGDQHESAPGGRRNASLGRNILTGGCLLLPLALFVLVLFWFHIVVGVQLLSSNVSCLLTCDRSPLATTLQLGDGDVRARQVYVVAIGQTVGMRVHDGIGGPVWTDPAVLRLIKQQQVGSTQLTTRYRAVGIGFAEVGFFGECHMGSCAAVKRSATIAVASTAAVVHLTGVDDGRIVHVERGHAVEVRQDDGWDWSFEPVPATDQARQVIMPCTNRSRTCR